MLTKEQREAIYRLALQQQHADLSDYLDSITVPEGPPGETGVMRDGCWYLAPAGSVCNKCGHVHGDDSGPKWKLVPTTVLQSALRALTESVDLVQSEYDTNWRQGMPTRKGQLDAMLLELVNHKDAIELLKKFVGDSNE